MPHFNCGRRRDEVWNWMICHFDERNWWWTWPVTIFVRNKLAFDERFISYAEHKIAIRIHFQLHLYENPMTIRYMFVSTMSNGRSKTKQQFHTFASNEFSSSEKLLSQSTEIDERASSVELQFSSYLFSKFRCCLSWWWVAVMNGSKNEWRRNRNERNLDGFESLHSVCMI